MAASVVGNPQESAGQRVGTLPKTVGLGHAGVPRRSGQIGPVVTYRQQLVERAWTRHGVITTRDAHELGVPVVELGKLAARGKLEPIAYGVYLVPEVPADPLSRYAEAVARVGPDAYLTGNAVLAVHGLVPIDLPRICVASPSRVRAKLPEFIEMVRRTDLSAGALTTLRDIPSTTVVQAILDTVGVEATDRLRQVTRDAAARGLVTTGERRRLRRALSVADPRTSGLAPG